jgi:hypothetical protein
MLDMINQKQLITNKDFIQQGWRLSTANDWAFYLPPKSTPPTVVFYNLRGARYIWYPRTGKLVHVSTRNLSLGNTKPWDWDEVIHILVLLNA